MAMPPISKGGLPPSLPEETPKANQAAANPAKLDVLKFLENQRKLWTKSNSSDAATYYSIKASLKMIKDSGLVKLFPRIAEKLKCVQTIMSTMKCC